jgi:hypothetical protein
VKGKNNDRQDMEQPSQAKREAKDLRQMGFTVKIKAFATWEEAEAYEEKLRRW